MERNATAPSRQAANRSPLKRLSRGAVAAWRRGVPLLLPLALLLGTSTAHAGGFYLVPRGVRGSAQGGAVVAGSDDPGALWYNPAGLGYSGRQVFFDLLMPLERVSFERINSGGQKDPEVSMDSAPLPLPGMAYSDDFGLRKLTLGLGFFAPPSAMLQYPQGAVYPETMQVGPPPQGYSSLGMEGSALVFFDFGLAYRPHPGISLGATAGVLAGKFQAKVLTFLADGGAMGQPESAEYDRPTEFGTDLLVRPTGSLGLILDFDELVGAPIRLGGSYRFAVAVEGDGSFAIDLPDAGLYADAELSDDRVHIRLDFPWIARAGVEIRPADTLRVELSYTHEHWSVQDSIRVESDLRIDNVPVLESYVVGDLDVQRKLRDSWAVGFGVEYDVLDRLTLRAGSMYERGSMTESTMSVLTPDPDKVALSVGAGYEVFDDIWLDFVYGHLFMRDQNVPRGTSRIYRLEALRPTLEPSGDPDDIGAGYPVPLGDGRYELEADYVGLGVRWLWGRVGPSPRS
jgi:long-chain fatty acid transport protein